MREKTASTDNIKYLLNWIAFVFLLAALGIHFLMIWFKCDAIICIISLQVLPSVVAVLATFLGVNLVLMRKKIAPSQLLKDEIVSDLFERLDLVKFDSARVMYPRFDLKGRLEKVKTVDIVAYSCRDLIKYFRSEFVDAAVNGTLFRIIIIEPSSPAVQLLEKHLNFTVAEHDINEARMRFHRVQEQIQAKMAKLGKKVSEGVIPFEVRYTTWIPSCSLIIMDRHGRTAVMKIKINPPHVNTNIQKAPINRIVAWRDEPILFEFYQNQFEQLWNDAKKESEVAAVVGKEKWYKKD